MSIRPLPSAILIFGPAAWRNIRLAGVGQFRLVVTSFFELNTSIRFPVRFITNSPMRNSVSSAARFKDPILNHAPLQTLSMRFGTCNLSYHVPIGR